MQVGFRSRVLIGVLFAGSILAIARPAAVATAAGGGTQHIGPFPSVTTDGSSCGPDWATDTVNRDFTVRDNGDGTFRVDEQFKNGTFVTLGTTSPGACEAAPHHGSTVPAGISGNFQGYYRFGVTSSAYNPQGCSANPSLCASTSGFVSAVFGTGATITCGSSTANCAFNFEYSSNDSSLAYRHWQDKSDNAPGINHGNDQFEGDIATS